MQQFTYTIKDPDGVHARPAGALIAAAKKYQSEVKLTANGKTISLKGGIFGLMGLGIRCGTTVLIVCEGEDENAAAQGLKESLEKLL